MISLKQINYALQIGKTLHFKKAADECFISASTLSNAINEMEKQLGFKIFERDNRRVIVTKQGEDFLEKAAAISLEVEDIKKISQLYAEPLSHKISIGMIPTISPFLIPTVLPRLNKDYPKLELQLVEAKSNELVNQIQNGEIDMGILALPYPIKDLRVLKFWAEDFFWICRADDERSKIQKITARELDLSELILLEEGNCLTDHVLSACNISFSRQHSFRVSNLNTLMQLVKGGMGTTLIPAMATEQLVDNDRMLTKAYLDEKSPHREIALLTRKTFVAMDEVGLLADIFSEELQKFCRTTIQNSKP